MISKRLEPISIRPADSTLVGSGALVTILMTPAEEFRPKSVPCGPDRTSTRATSKSWGGVVDPEPSDTLSTTTPTLPSEDREKPTLPLPRMLSAPNEPEALSAGEIGRASWRERVGPYV